MYTSGNAFGCLEIAWENDRPLLDVAAHRSDHFGERLRLGLIGEDAERPDQGQAGSDHCRQLPREDDDVAETDLAATTADGDVRAELRLALAGDRDRYVAELAELGDDELLALTLDAALVYSTCLVANLVRVRRAHRPSRSGDEIPSRLRRSSGFDACSTAVSRLIRLDLTSSARFWSIVTIPNLAPACIWLAS